MTRNDVNKHAGAAAMMFALGLCLLSSTLQARPERVVSINQCTDELLLALADSAQIASVTHFVQDAAVSWDATAAKAFPANQGLAEEVLAYAPDLVLAGDFSSRQTIALLRYLGLEVAEVAHPRSLAQVLQNIRRVAGLVGHAARGERLAAELVAALGEPRQVHLSAAVYQPNGYTTGGDSLLGEMLALAGFANAAQQRGLREYAKYPLELLVWDTPDVLVLDPQWTESPSLAHEVLRHPVLRTVFRSAQVTTIAPQAVACGNQHIAAAVKQLHRVAHNLGPDRS